MKITESKLRSIIRSIILESGKKSYMPSKKFGDMSFKYNNIEVEIIDGGDVYIYGNIDAFNSKVKALFEKINVEEIVSLIKKYNKDDTLDAKKKKLRKLSLYKPVKKALLDSDFLKMMSEIRVCKFVKAGEEDWFFYDMSLRALFSPESNVTQYAYLGKDSEKEGEEADPGLRALGLFKRELKPKNFIEMPRELAKLANKIGKLKLIFMDRKMMSGFRSNSEIKSFLIKHDEMKKFIKNQYEFNPDTQKFLD